LLEHNDQEVPPGVDRVSPSWRFEQLAVYFLIIFKFIGFWNKL
jgi:hypothetical protein